MPDANIQMHVHRLPAGCSVPKVRRKMQTAVKYLLFDWGNSHPERYWIELTSSAGF